MGVFCFMRWVLQEKSVIYSLPIPEVPNYIAVETVLKSEMMC